MEVLLQELVVLKRPRFHIRGEGEAAVDQIELDFLYRPPWQVTCNVRDAEDAINFDDIPHNVVFMRLKFDPLARLNAPFEVTFGEFEPTIYYLICCLIFNEEGNDTPLVGASVKGGELKDDFILLSSEPIATVMLLEHQLSVLLGP